MSAWHHKKLAPDLTAMSAEQISGQARQFASRDYLHAIYKGDRMSPEERTKVVANLSRLTGLSKAFIATTTCALPGSLNAELMRDQHRGSPAPMPRQWLSAATQRGGRVVVAAASASPPAPIDFNLSGLAAGFQTAYESYLRRELTFTGNSNGIFYLSSGGVGAFTATGTDDASLSGAFARHPNLRLFVGVNYFDLHAPFYATEFALAHLSVSPEVRAHNITVSHYEAGQMTYLDNKRWPNFRRPGQVCQRSDFTGPQISGADKEQCHENSPAVSP